jgi:olefin beta-lactone synthetase
MSAIGYFPGLNTKNNVLTFLEKHAAESPKALILSWAKPESLKAWDRNPATPIEHQSITVEAFNDQIGRVAEGLKRLGLKKGDRAILFLPMSVSLYLAMFALQRIGAIAVFLDSWARRGQLGISAQVVDPVAMISFEKAFDGCQDVPELSSLPIRIVAGPASKNYTARLEDLARTDSHAELVAVESEDTALITFTTGSSGVPKGANRTHRFLAAQHFALDKSIPYQNSDIDLPVFPIFSLNNLAAGVPTVIPALDVGVPSDNDSALLIAQILSAKVNCMTLSPSLLNSLSAFCIEKKLSLPELRRVITGGAPISRDNLVDFTSIAPNAEVWVLYGSTEVEPMADIEAKEMISFKSRSQDDSEWVDPGVNVGRMVEGLQYRFLRINKDPVFVQSAHDWNDLEVAKGEVGELIVAGEHVCRDYYNNSEAFFRAKVRDEAGVVWHRTGDLGFIDGNGYLWIVGRVHNAIHRAGRYAFPVRSEIVMKKLTFVGSCAYLGYPSSTLGEATVCVIVPKNLSDLNDAAEKQRMETEIRRIMAKNEIPVDHVVFRSSVPLDPRHHSKVEYDMLREDLKNNKEIPAV